MSSPLRNPRLQLMLVIGLITASGFWVWWFAQYQPQIVQIEVLVEHENRLRVGNQQARRTVAALGLDKIRDAIDAYDRQAEHVSALVPADTVPLDMLALVSGAAQQVDVRVGGVQPLPEESSGDFRVNKYQVRASGEYHDVASFMTELLSQPRITRVTEAQVRQVQIPGATLSHGIEASFTLAVYATRAQAQAPAQTSQPETAQASQGDE